MKAPQLLDNDVQEIASLLIPLEHNLLLVPNVTVAEIVPVSQVIPIVDAPHWYLGNCRWRDQTIPLLSFEALSGGAKPGYNPRSRFAVFNTTGSNDSLAFIALLTQGLPRLARVNEEEISQREQSLAPCELMHVSWAGEEAIIPDVAAIEREFLAYLRP